MAKVRGSKEGFLHDSSISMPTEQKTSESNKQKIAKIHEIFPETTKDNIAKILQYYEEDENKAMDAITRDGGSEALSNWAESGSLKSRNNKNKKKKKKSKRDNVAGMTTTASFDADDSSSLHSGGNIDNEVEKECQKTENGILSNVAETDDRTSYHDHLSNNVINQTKETVQEIEPYKIESSAVISPPTPPEESLPIESVSSSCDKPIEASSNPPSPDVAEKQEDQGVKKEKYRSINDHNRNSPRRRTSSFRRNKTPSISEDASSQHNQQASAAPITRGYDRCKKDLNRQTVSLQRIQAQLEKGFEESEKKCKKAFNEYIKLMENRQKDVEAELAKTKIEAFNLLKSRQDLAVELKRRVDRAPSISEAEWTELRSDIKQFVTERKYDDDLGKTIWFQWTDLSDIINQFGEVQPVKNVYSQRSHYALGKSGVTNNPEPSPSPSLANEEIESTSVKNCESTVHDVSNIADAVEDEVTSVGKHDEMTHFNKNQTNENRTSSRIFSNSKQYGNHGRYNNNRGGPGNRTTWRGNRGVFRGNDQRGNYRGHFYPQNRNNYGEDYNRNNPHTDRPPFFDRNLRDNKGNRNFRRGYNSNYKYNRYNREGNASGYQSNVDGTGTNEPPANSPVSTTEKTVVNGFVDTN